MIFTAHKPLILASTSPRRRDYLTELGLSFTLCSAEIDETPRQQEVPVDYVKRMAREKAAAVKHQHAKSYILAADTSVCLGDTILGKPVDTKDAVQMLMQLSGRTHQVFSGICLANVDEIIEEVAAVCTDVTFSPFDEQLAMAYVNENESLDKAGGYGIQSKGGFLVERISGSYSNVVGLPLTEVVALLSQHGVITV